MTQKTNILGGKVTLDGDVVQAENTLGNGYSVVDGELYYNGDPLTGRYLMGQTTQAESDVIESLQ